MLPLLLILIIIACCLLVVIILAQNPKGGGLSSIGAGASQFLGARQTADFLEKSTWYFGIGILVVVFITYFLTSGPADKGGFESKTKGTDLPISNQAPKKAPAKAAPGGAVQIDGNGNQIQTQEPAAGGAQQTPPAPPVPLPSKPAQKK